MATSSRGKLTPRRIFISYARKDGTATAHQLSQMLKGNGCDVWIDTERIRGGTCWSKEIEIALTRCEVLVAVLTPESYESETCRAEQTWALDEGKLVVPILAAPGTPVPIYLKSLQYRKYPEQESQLLLDIAAEAGPVGSIPRVLRYDTVPNLPQGYLARDNVVAALRDLVFTESGDASIAVTALAGMGGIGKTVLATALCHDLAVQRAFPDGIAWVTFGRERSEDLSSRMREIGRALGESVESWDSFDACENRYRGVLLKKAALIVVDDVWSLEQLKPMLVKAPRSRLLFTTRDTTIANAVSTRSFSADLLTKLEARGVLARASRFPLAQLPSEASGIIDKCSGLALAIAQIGGSLRGKPASEWKDTLRALRTVSIRDLEERLPSGQISFFRSLAVSVDALPHAMKERFSRLAVLIEDTPARLEMLQALWRLDERTTRHTARYMVDRSLAFWAVGDGPSRGIRLHDLQLDYVRAGYADQEALALIVAAERLAASVVEQDPSQFPSQMVGRLLEHDLVPGVRSFSAEISEGAHRPWLRPLWPSLLSPGGEPAPVRGGHLASVIGVALTLDGKRVVSCSLDDTLKVWDTKTGKERLTLRGHRLGVYGVAVSGDGRRAVSASLDKTLKVWDLKKGREVSTIRAAHSRGVASVVLSADGRRAISASWDKTLKLWDLDAGTSLRTFKGHTKCVNSVAVSATWKIAISASEDSTLKVWSVETGDLLRTLRGHSADVWAVAVTPNAKLALSASEDKTLKLWDVETGRKLRTLRGHKSAVYGVAMSQDGSRAISGSDDMTVKIWDVRRGKVLHTLKGHSLTVMSVAMSGDGAFAASCSYDASVRLWDVATGMEIRTLEGRSDALNAVAIPSDGRKALFASDDKTLKMWDVETAKCIGTLRGHSGDVCDVAISDDGQRAASVSGDETLRVWDLTGEEETQELKNNAWVNGIAVSADFRVAVSACDDNVLNVWDLNRAEKLRELKGHRSSVYAVALNADGRVAVSASYDSTLRVWDVETGRTIHRLVGHCEPVTYVVVTNEGRKAVSGSDDGSIRVWDLRTGKITRTIEAHADSVSYLAINTDQKYLASASWDKTIKMWDLATGSLLTTFTCDAPPICCGFVIDGHLIAGDNLGRVHLLSFEVQ